MQNALSRPLCLHCEVQCFVLPAVIHTIVCSIDVSTGQLFLSFLCRLLLPVNLIDMIWYLALTSTRFTCQSATPAFHSPASVTVFKSRWFWADVRLSSIILWSVFLLLTCPGNHLAFCLILSLPALCLVLSVWSPAFGRTNLVVYHKMDYLTGGIISACVYWPFAEVHLFFVPEPVKVFVHHTSVLWAAFGSCLQPWQLNLIRVCYQLYYKPCEDILQSPWRRNNDNICVILLLNKGKHGDYLRCKAEQNLNRKCGTSWILNPYTAFSFTDVNVPPLCSRQLMINAKKPWI